MDVSEAKRLKWLEDENASLKRLLVNAMLDDAALKDLMEKMVTPAATRQAAAHLLAGYDPDNFRAIERHLRQPAHAILSVWAMRSDGTGRRG